MKLDNAMLLHRYRGENWHLHVVAGKRQAPVLNKQPLKTFVNSGPACALDVVYVVGVPENADLVVALKARRKQVGRPEIRICSPKFCNNEKALKTPSALLNCVSGVAPAHWRTWSEVELQAFDALVNYRRIYQGEPVTSGMLCNTHPVQLLATFFRGVTHESMLALIAAIIHPSWYTTSDWAVTSNKWTNQVGVWMTDLMTMFQPKVQRDPATRYAVFGHPVTTAWLGGDFPGNLEKATAAPEDYFLRYCCNYYRTFRDVTFKPRSQSAKELWVQAIYTTTAHFIEMLCMFWLHVITRSGDGMFVPQYFFCDPATATAVQQHLAQFRLPSHNA